MSARTLSKSNASGRVVTPLLLFARGKFFRSPPQQLFSSLEDYGAPPSAERMAEVIATQLWR